MQTLGSHLWIQDIDLHSGTKDPRYIFIPRKPINRPTTTGAASNKPNPAEQVVSSPFVGPWTASSCPRTEAVHFQNGSNVWVEPQQARTKLNLYTWPDKSFKRIQSGNPSSKATNTKEVNLKLKIFLRQIKTQTQNILKLWPAAKVVPR